MSCTTICRCKFMSVPWGLSVFVMEIHVVHNNMQFNFATDCKILCLLLNLCSDVLIWIKGLKFVRCFNLDAFVLMFKSYFEIIFCGNFFNLDHFIAFLFSIVCKNLNHSQTLSLQNFQDFMFLFLNLKYSLHILAIYIFMRCNPLHFTYLLPET